MEDIASSTFNIQEFIFENCNTISNHIANLPVTVGLLDYNLFSRMKENAVFINTGRGAQIKEADLQLPLICWTEWPKERVVQMRHCYP